MKFRWFPRYLPVNIPVSLKGGGSCCNILEFIEKLSVFLLRMVCITSIQHNSRNCDHHSRSVANLKLERLTKQSIENETISERL